MYNAFEIVGSSHTAVMMCAIIYFCIGIGFSDTPSPFSKVSFYFLNYVLPEFILTWGCALPCMPFIQWQTKILKFFVVVVFGGGHDLPFVGCLKKILN